MKRSIVILLAMLLSACGVVPQSEKEALKNSADEWVGRTVDELIVANGEPTNIFQLESGGREFEYLKDSVGIHNWLREHIKEPSQRRLTSKFSGYFSHYGRTTGSKPAKEPCRILFIVSASDIVTSWSIEGEKCD